MEKLYLGVDLHMRSCRVTVPDADGHPRDLLPSSPALTSIDWNILGNSNNKMAGSTRRDNNKIAGYTRGDHENGGVKPPLRRGVAIK